MFYKLCTLDGTFGLSIGTFGIYYVQKEYAEKWIIERKLENKYDKKIQLQFNSTSYPQKSLCVSNNKLKITNVKCYWSLINYI